jgi:thioredoxin reductase
MQAVGSFAVQAHERRSRDPEPVSDEVVPVTIIGAGPYGLSVAAHLRGHGVTFRIIGKPMKSWLSNMPSGMRLKSTGYSSTLYDPAELFTIRQYCRERNIPFEDVGLPVQVETFSSYGLAFQKRFVPEVEEHEVVLLARCAEGFRLQLDDGGSFKSRSIVIGIGLEHFRNMPAELVGLPRNLVSHSGEHGDLERFRGRTVAVIGAGSSAIDIATFLQERGCNVHLIARKEEIEFGHDEQLRRPLLSRIQRPMSGIGPGWKNILCARLPGLFRYLPESVRVSTVGGFLGPSGGWFMKKRFAEVPRLLGYEIESAKVQDGRLDLLLVSSRSEKRHFTADHVIAATGYRMDVRRLAFLSADLRTELTLIRNSPRLSAHFESSVPGLYFVGPISAMTFGPVMRFAAGAGFTARRLSKHLGLAVSAA